MNVNKATLNGIVFAIGFVLGILGYIGHVYSSGIATALMVGTWFLGYALVNLLVKPNR